VKLPVAWVRGRLSAVGIVLLVLGVLGLLPTAVGLVGMLGAPGEAWAAVSDGVMWERWWRTLGLGLWTLMIAVPLGWGMAWLLTRTDLPGRRVLWMLVPLPLFLPPLVHVLTWYVLFGLKGKLAVVVVYVIAFTPIVVWFCGRALGLVGRERYEAALLLGGRRAALEDELRISLPAALAGGAVILVWVLSDFAVADFLTSVGPKVTVYTDTLYRHHLGSGLGAVAAASLPALLLGGVVLAGVLWMHRGLGETVSGRHVMAPSFRLGRWRGWVGLAVWGWVGGCAFVPMVVLGWRTGSADRFLGQALMSAERVWFSYRMGAVAATMMVGLALPLAWGVRRWRRVWRWEWMICLPLAVPPLLHGVGLIQIWNRPGLDWIYLGTGMVWMAVVSRYLVFAYLPLKAGVERLDDRMFDGARLAGAGGLRQVLQLGLPLTRNAVLGAWCLAFCMVVRELDALMLLRAGQRTLAFQLQSHMVFARPDEVAAIGLLWLLSLYVPWALYLGLVRRPLNLW
jgi:iron(III) transport system permease protein